MVSFLPFAFYGSLKNVWWTIIYKLFTEIFKLSEARMSYLFLEEIIWI